VGPDAKDAEYCFNLVAHGAQAPLPQDDSPFIVPNSEFYHEFEFRVPYGEPVVALSTKPIIEERRMVARWFLYHVDDDMGTDGAHRDEIGIDMGRELVAAWAPGATLPEVPPGIGVEMPKAGGYMVLEFHYLNPEPSKSDRSGVRVCVTTKEVEHVATLTWLGTDDLHLPAHQTTDASGTCHPVNDQDVHLFYSTPQMNALGRHMKAVVSRSTGEQVTFLDTAFSYFDQRTHVTDAVVHTGDTLTTTCTFRNDTDQVVTWGTSYFFESCYNFVYAYPAHALSNPNGAGLIGATNMCEW
jgi:hypothetical protein